MKLFTEPLRKREEGKQQKKIKEQEAKWFEKGESYVETGQLKKAIFYFTQAIGCAPESDRGYARRGEIQYLQGNFPDAFSDLSQATSLNPKNYRVLGLLALTNLGKKEPEAAEKILFAKDLPSAAANDTFFQMARGQLHLEKKQFTQAIAAFQKAWEYDNSNIAAFSKLINLLTEQNQFTEKENFLAQAKQAANNLILKIKENLSAGKWDTVINQCNTVIALDGKNSFAYAAQGEAYRHKGEQEKAKLQLHRTIELDDANDNAYAYLGLIYLSLKQYPIAKKYFTRATEINEGNYLANYGLTAVNIEQCRLLDKQLKQTENPDQLELIKLSELLKKAVAGKKKTNKLYTHKFKLYSYEKEQLSILLYQIKKEISQFTMIEYLIRGVDIISPYEDLSEKQIRERTSWSRNNYLIDRLPAEFTHYDFIASDSLWDFFNDLVFTEVDFNSKKFQKKVTALLEKINNLIADDPQDIGNYYYRAEIYRISQNLSEALKDYQLVHQEFPNAVLFYLKITDVYTEQLKTAPEEEKEKLKGLRLEVLEKAKTNRLGNVISYPTPSIFLKLSHSYYEEKQFIKAALNYYLALRDAIGDRQLAEIQSVIPDDIKWLVKLIEEYDTLCQERLGVLTKTTTNRSEQCRRANQLANDANDKIFAMSGDALNQFVTTKNQKIKEEKEAAKKPIFESDYVKINECEEEIKNYLFHYVKSVPTMETPASLKELYQFHILNEISKKEGRRHKTSAEMEQSIKQSLTKQVQEVTPAKEIIDELVEVNNQVWQKGLD